MSITRKASNWASKTFVRASSAWASVQQAPADKILGITTAFQQDKSPHKINLGVGAYRGDDGKPWVLPTVKQAEQILLKTEGNKEYVPITGTNNYNDLIKRLLFGHDEAGNQLLAEGRIVTSQGISGTGSLRVIGEFIADFYPVKKVLIPNPTWANHAAILHRSGLETQAYSYYNYQTNKFDMENAIADLSKAPEGAAILLHACCHNPTGVDPTTSQWDRILETVCQKKFLPIVDMAYQGFRTGDTIKDLELIWRFNSLVKSGEISNFMVSQSFAKNMGLYGERVGSLAFVTDSSEESVRIRSQLAKIIRPLYSSPPSHGSKLVEIILGDAALKKQWLKEVAVMNNRLVQMRKLLFENLKSLGNTLNWDHLLEQKGMFCYTGLSAEQVGKLANKSIYMTYDGRISIAGITPSNVGYLAKGIHEVTN